MKFSLQKNKRVGHVLFVLEGEDTEPHLIYRIFCGIFGYQMERIYRDGEYRVFHRTDDPFSRITVINTEESNIQFINKDNEYLNRLFMTLIEDYGFDLDNSAIYYIFDRDPKSNKDVEFIMDMIRKLANSRDVNENMTRQGLLLLSYPCIESFIGMNFLENSIDYCFRKGIEIGKELKFALNEDRLLPNHITEESLLHCAKELLKSLEVIGIDVTIDAFMNSLDHFGENNKMIYSWQEQQYAALKRYGLLSLFTIAFFDLGLIQLET